MSTKHTPGPRSVLVTLPSMQQCEVHYGTDGDISFVRLLLRTNGDSQNTHRSLRRDGPTARAAIAKAEGTAS